MSLTAGERKDFSIDFFFIIWAKSKDNTITNKQIKMFYLTNYRNYDVLLSARWKNDDLLCLGIQITEYQQISLDTHAWPCTLFWTDMIT